MVIVANASSGTKLDGDLVPMCQSFQSECGREAFHDHYCGKIMNLSDKRSPLFSSMSLHEKLTCASMKANTSFNQRGRGPSDDENSPAVYFLSKQCIFFQIQLTQCIQ